MVDDRAYYDELTWDRNDTAWEDSQKPFRCLSSIHKIEAFAPKLLGKTANLGNSNENRRVYHPLQTTDGRI